MRGLNIILTVPDAERLRGALVLASAQAALGGDAAIFLQLDAVALLRAPVTAPCDDAHLAAGLPKLGALLDDAIALGVAIIACQSGLTLAGMTAEALPTGVECGGPIAFLSGCGGEARLLIG